MDGLTDDRWNDLRRHSPAPWRVGKKQERAVLDANGSQIAVIPKSIKYDAALIAAAPEMLAMLKGIITVHPITREPDFLNANFHEIELLIAKAEPK